MMRKWLKEQLSIETIDFFENADKQQLIAVAIFLVVAGIFSPVFAAGGITTIALLWLLRP